jgi:nucleotide-binding universal stress UspA family protein
MIFVFRKKGGTMRIEFGRILCATDLSESSSTVIRYGSAVAEAFDGELFAAYVVQIPVPAAPSAAQALSTEQIVEIADAGREKLESLLEGAAGRGETVVRHGPAAETLADLAVELKIDLAVVATRGLGGLRRLVLGSVTERLIRIVSCPLLIVTPKESEAGRLPAGSWHPRRILVGCDFSPDSARALETALSLAQEFEAELHLVHAIEPFAYRDVLLSDSVPGDMKERIETEMKRRLEELALAEASAWCTIRVRCLSGRSHEELLRYARREQMDLIVLGVRGRSLMESLMLGSTTDRVIRQAACPVLSVCPPRPV